MKLIVGLGNPGRTYAHNRHNVGFRCINYVSKLHSIPVKQWRCRSQVGIGRMDGVDLLLVKPKTFVNLSGEAVDCLMRRYKAGPEDLLVICDDLDLPLGKLRLRQGGSSGGHRGMESIASALGSQDFCRIKVGIGRPGRDDETAVFDENTIVSYVLSDFTSQEEVVIKPAVAIVAEAVRCVVTEGMATAMNEFN